MSSSNTLKHKAESKQLLQELLDRMKISKSNLRDEDLEKLAEELTSDSDFDDLSIRSGATLSPELDSPISPFPDTPMTVSESIGSRQRTRALEHQLAMMELEWQQKLLRSDTYRKEAEQHASQLGDEAAALRHQLQLERLQHDRDVRAWEQKVKELQEKTGKYMMDLKHKMEKLEVESPSLVESIADAKRQFTDVICSDAQYAEWKRSPESRIGVKEYIMCKVYESIHPVVLERDALRRESELLKFSVQEATEMYNKLKLEMESRNAKVVDDLTLTQSEVTSLSTRLKRAEQSAKEAAEVVDNNRQKAALYDALQQRCTQSEQKLAQLEADIAAVQSSLQSVTTERDVLRAEKSSLSQEVEILRVDKVYLSRELDAQRTTVNSLEDRVASLRMKKRNLKSQISQIQTSASQGVDLARHDYESRLKEEIHRLQRATQSDLEAIRSSAKEAQERECRVLRESRDEALATAEKLKAVISDAKQAASLADKESKTVIAALERELTELRSSLKVRTFEFERLGVHHAQLQDNLRQGQTETEVLRQKLQVARDEFHALERESTRKILETEGELATVKERLRYAQAAAMDVDAILRHAVGGEASLPLLAKEHDGYENMKATPAVPIQLAKRLIEAQDRARQAMEERDRLSKELHIVQQQLREAEEALKHVAQPSSYLLQTIRQKEMVLQTLQKAQMESQSKLAESETQSASLRIEVDHLRKELSSCLKRQSLVANLKAALSKLRSGEDMADLLSSIHQ